MRGMNALTALSDDYSDGSFGLSGRANPSWNLVWLVAIE